MTLDDMAHRLATMHDSNVVVILDRITAKEQMYLCANLREPLKLRGAELIKPDPRMGGFTVRRQNGAETRCHLTSVVNTASFLKGFHPDTAVFTISRTGIYETKAQ